MAWKRSRVRISPGPPNSMIKNPPKEYIKYIDGVYRIGNTRVSLDSLIYLFREGMSADGMVECYSALSLEQVHGALAFYLANQKEIDTYLADGQRAAES